MNKQRFVIAAAIVLSNISITHAAITTVGPFAGQHSDTFDEYTNVNAVQSLPVCGGFCTLSNLTPGGAIKIEFSSLFAGHQVIPISGMMVGQLGIGQWTFTQPVSRFGAYFENNSGQNDATVAFYDAQNNLLGQVIANIPFNRHWTWNGWNSDVPFSKMVVTGNGTINGFLWYENVQVNAAVPGPGALTFWMGLLGMMNRRRR